MYHLYEEYKEYEKMWDEPTEIKATTLTEGLIIQLLAEVVATVSFFVGTIGAVSILLSGGGLVVALTVAIGSLVIKILAELISEYTLPVFPIVGMLTEDITDQETVLEQSIATVDIHQKAQTNSKIQKQVQRLYALVGPEKAQKIITRVELWLHKQSKPLAKLLKGVTVTDLETNEEIIIQQALKHVQTEMAKDTTKES